MGIRRWYDNDSRRECPLTGIPTDRNTQGREFPPLISLEVGIRGSVYLRCVGREYPAPAGVKTVVHVIQYQIAEHNNSGT